MIADRIYTGDALTILFQMDAQSVDCIITSPPYYGLRDYGIEGQLGKERTPEDYIDRLVAVFHEAKRVLKDNGTLWINIGDSYNGSNKGGANYPENARKYNQGTNRGSVDKPIAPTHVTNCKPKDLIGIPWMLAFALRADGWYLRQDIIWHKPNCMPESVRDRCTKSHEYIFLLSKTKQYFFDGEAISEECADSSIKRYQQNIDQQKGSTRVPYKTNGNMKAALPRYGGKKYTEHPDQFYRTKSGSMYDPRPRRNKRDVWTVSTNGFKGAHFATFPEKLIEPCILAGCPTGGVVLDPFLGSGTTAAVAARLGRRFVGIEINPDYVKIAEDRISSITHQGKQQEGIIDGRTKV